MSLPPNTKGQAQDLQELIGSLGIELYTPVKHAVDRSITGNKGAEGGHVPYSSIKSFQSKLVNEAYIENEIKETDVNIFAKSNTTKFSNRNMPQFSPNLNNSSITNTLDASYRKDASNGLLSSTDLEEDINDVTTLRYGSKVSLRGCLGKYLSAHLSLVEPNGNEDIKSGATKVTYEPHLSGSATTANVASSIYILGIDGYGIGNICDDISDCLVFVPIDHRDSATMSSVHLNNSIVGSADVSNSYYDTRNVIRYGQTIAIKAPGAKEKLLGIRDSTKLGFWRNLVGQGEKWTILKANTGGQTSSVAGTGAHTSLLKSNLLEDVAARGRPVHIGDSLLIQAGPLLSRDQTATGILSLSEYVLSLYEGIDGAMPKLVSKDRVSLGNEHWLLETFNSQPIPPFMMKRPYLNGRFILTPADQRLPHPSTERLLFPYSSSNTNSDSTLTLKSTDEQVQAVLRDILLTLSGIAGRFIHVVVPDAGGALRSNRLKDVTLAVQSDDIDRSLADQVATFLPLCQNVLRVREYIRRHMEYDYGLVAHAFNREIMSLFREFELLIAQLETLLIASRRPGSPPLTLQKLIFLLQPSSIIFRQLAELCTNCDYAKGGELLNILYLSLQEQGDMKMKQLFGRLFERSFAPFKTILENWLIRGDLQDTYREFFVEENEAIKRDTLLQDVNAQYWESKYTLVDRHIPVFMKNYAIKVLVAGKYHNVLKGLSSTQTRGEATCGTSELSAVRMFSSQYEEYLDSDDMDGDNVKVAAEGANTAFLRDLTPPKSVDVDLKNHDKLFRSIEDCYQYSSRALLLLLEKQYSLSTHLRSLRRFFLFEHGDFFTQFLDLASDELRKESKSIRLTSVQNLLHIAVQTSTLSNELHKEGLTCTLEPHNLIQHLHLIQTAGQGPGFGGALPSVQPYAQQQSLTGFESLVLDYRVQWPLSIVLSRRAVTKYQLLSRMLFFSKYVEMRILGSWKEHQTTKSLSVRAQMGAYFCLRQRMLHFLQNFVYYMTVEVIKPRDHEMQADMARAQDMDEVMLLHEKFLDTCLKECLLASQELLNGLTKILATCVLFADHVNEFMHTFEDLAIPKSFTPVRKVKSTQANIAKVGNRRISAPSTNEDNDEAILQQRAIQTANELVKRKLKNNMQTDFIMRESRKESFAKYRMLFEEKFDKEVSDFLEKLWTDSYQSHSQLSNLCVRLDYNGYYSQRFVNENAY